jgi:hypothetical protein
MRCRKIPCCKFSRCFAETIIERQSTKMYLSMKRKEKKNTQIGTIFAERMRGGGRRYLRQGTKRHKYDEEKKNLILCETFI